jgi:penicillin-binding protein 1C
LVDESSRPDGNDFPRPKRGRRWFRRDRLGLIAAVIIVLAGAPVILGLGHIRDLEAQLPEFPAPSDIATSTVVLDRDGRLLRPFTIADGRWRLPVTKADVDQRFLDFLIAYEDRRFVEHEGVDWSAMVRAAGQFVLAGGQIVSGGSTLTMQVARLIGGEPTRDIDAKLAQILMARKLEARFTKDEILTLYLMLAPYGGNVEGVRAASLAYFGKEPTRLTPAEAALLVALPQSPEARPRPRRRPRRSEPRARPHGDRRRARCGGGGGSEDRTGAGGAARFPDARRAPYGAGARGSSR